MVAVSLKKKKKKKITTKKKNNKKKKNKKNKDKKLTGPDATIHLITNTIVQHYSS